MTPADTALIMLASGLSNRFGADDKLLADFRGKPLAAHAAKLWCDTDCAARIAVLPSSRQDRARIFEQAGWQIVTNPAPENGQGSSLKIGAAQIRTANSKAAIICLADMPFVPDTHLDQLCEALGTNDAVISKCGDVLLPPAIFASHTFDQLVSLSGDRGAKQVFKSLQRTDTLPLGAKEAIDIDTPERLAELQEQA